jgi:hypothetical protein
MRRRVEVVPRARDWLLEDSSVVFTPSTASGLANVEKKRVGFSRAPPTTPAQWD